MFNWQLANLYINLKANISIKILNILAKWRYLFLQFPSHYQNQFVTPWFIYNAMFFSGMGRGVWPEVHINTENYQLFTNRLHLNSKINTYSNLNIRSLLPTLNQGTTISPVFVTDLSKLAWQSSSIFHVVLNMLSLLSFSYTSTFLPTFR
jgi:hypothetical protein